MAFDAETKEKLIKNREMAAKEGQLIKEAESIDFDFLDEHIRRYILYKYQIPPEEADTDNFAELTSKSLEITSKLSPELAEEVRNAKSCDGASSTNIKKALLLQSIQRLYDIRLDPMKAVMATTLKDLSLVIWEAFEKSPSWKDKLVQ